MKHSFKIKLPTYNCELQFCVLDGLNAEVNKLYKKYKVNEVFDGSAEGILFTPDIDKYILLIDIKYLTHNTIAHEIYHLVTRITEDRGIIDEESQAWLAGLLSQIMYDYIKKNNLVVKNG